MPVSLDVEIRSQLAKYLADEQSLEEFVAWFSPHTWNIQQSAPAPITELAYTIDLLLSEYSEGGWTEEQFRAQLRPLIEDYSVSFSYNSAPLVIVTTDALTIENEINWAQETQSKTAGTVLEWVFA